MKAVSRAIAAAVVSVTLLVTARAGADSTCQIANVTPMIFGVYPSGSSFPLDSTGELDVTCASPSAVRISFGRGLSGRQTPRRMAYRGAALAYNLFMDAARTVVWGDGTEGTQSLTGTVPAGQTLRFPIFGRVFALQGVPSGSYVDRIDVFIVF